jgi:LysR family transcriptional regulator of abg operon
VELALTEKHLLARLRFRHLQLLTEIERTGSLSKSAAVLSLTQPALSKALKEVEAMLGFPIFSRGSRGLQKTPQGEIVLRGASLLIRELQHLHVEAKSAGPTGKVGGILRLGAPAFLSVTFIPQVVARLTRLSPPLAVSLSESNVPSLVEALSGGTLDALITVYNAGAMAAASNRGARFEKFAEAPYVVIAPSAHPLARLRKVSWKTLSTAPWIMTCKPSLARYFAEDSFRSHGVEPPSPLCETVSPVTSAYMVAEGIGISNVPAVIAREAEARGGVRRVSLDVPQPNAMLGLVYRSVAASDPRIAALRNAVQQASTRSRF